MIHCSKCKSYQKELEEYKEKYEIAKSGLTKEERNILIELICNEQLKHLLVRNEYASERYKKLEEIKVKIQIV